jgi:hypothetical protein
MCGPGPSHLLHYQNDHGESHPMQSDLVGNSLSKTEVLDLAHDTRRVGTTRTRALSDIGAKAPGTWCLGGSRRLPSATSYPSQMSAFGYPLVPDDPGTLAGHARELASCAGRPDAGPDTPTALLPWTYLGVAVMRAVGGR